jgi:hypothetical protein
MITAKNLSSAEIDFSKLPAKFKEDYGDIVEMVPYMDQEPDFKQVVNSYVTGLNKELSKAKAPTPDPELGKKLQKLQRELNSERLRVYQEGDNSPEEKARKKEREEKLKEFEAIQKQLSKSGKPTTKKPRQSSADKAKKAAEIAAAKRDVEAMQKQAGLGEFAKFNRSQILEQAQAFHKRRRLSAQMVDESVDHKKRLTPTPENLVRWMKEPGKFDLIGVDTFEKNNPTADLKIKKEIFWHRLLKK